ncbi:MAG: condensation domain-containing protein, partial [Arcicella sp.]|nr:condensation domain-containing protein [Arcicella sp.]
MSNIKNRDIAIIGMAGRFPDAKNIEELHNNLLCGKDSIRKISKERLKKTTLPENKNYSIYGYMDDIDVFDFTLFGISKGEAESMDPHQRQLLEVVYETFENSGYSIDYFAGTKTSVYVGDQQLNYYKHADVFNPTLITGNGSEFLAARISRAFNLTGGVAVIDTSCSSSLVALHTACNELILENATHALVCGVNLELFPFVDETGYHAGVSSPDGNSRPFSASANGMVFGEAVVSILLKPLEKAIEDQDNIHAIIKSSAVNNNANRSASLTAPDAVAQAEVIQTAWEKANINPQDIGYIEAHGSATQLGDTIEVGGIELAFKNFTNEVGFCPISSIKGNIGHSRSAAGIVGLVRAVLALKHKKIFPIPNFDSPSDFVSLKNSPIYIPTELKDWDTSNCNSRLAGLSSIGFSGTNVHVVLQEYLSDVRQAPYRPDTDYLITVSGKTRKALNQNLDAFLLKIEDFENTDLPNIAFTLGAGRKHYEYRFSSIVRNLDELKDAIQKYINSEKSLKSKNDEKIIFILSDIQQINPVAFDFLMSHFPVFSDLYNHNKQICINQVTLINNNIEVFLYQYSCFQLMLQLGFKIPQIVGVGIGKIVANVISNTITFSEALEEASLYIPTPIANLTERIDKLVLRETETTSVVFIELGAEGTLSKALKSKVKTSDKIRVFCMDNQQNEGLVYLLQSLYQANYSIDFQNYFQYPEAKRIELFSYQFEKNRCWIRETPRIEEELSVKEKQILRELNVSELIRIISICWDEALELNDLISIHDDFFLIGGDSIKATRVINLINKKLNLTLSFEDIFDFSTIDSLAKYLESNKTVVEKLSVIWQAILKTETLDLDADFFELGGHSLIANHILNAIRKEFGVELNFEDFYKNTTINLLSALIEEKLSKSESKNSLTSIPPTPQKALYPVSNGQKRLWQIGQIEEVSVAYNTPNIFQINGNLDKNTLKIALQKLINRHEILRTTFVSENDEVFQKVEDFSKKHATLIFEDVRTQIEPVETAKKLIDDIIKKPFDFKNGPLFEVFLFQLEENNFILLLNIHHIISDGISFEILLNDLFTYYSNIQHKLSFELPPLTIQYKDYSVWYNQLLLDESMKVHQDYWMNMFAGELPTLDLPTTFPRPSIMTHNGQRIIKEIPDELSANLRKFNTKSGVSSFTSILAFLKILLCRYSNQQDVVVGFPSDGRIHPDLENQIGYYSSTIALRTNIEEDCTFESLLDTLKSNVMEAYSHQVYPFDNILSDIKYKRNLSRSPLFDVMLAMQSREKSQDKLFVVEGISISSFETELKTSQMDLVFSVFENEENFTICLDFNSDLFSKDFADQLLNHLLSIADESIKFPSKSIWELDFLPKSTLNSLLGHHCHTFRDYSFASTLVSMFERSVACHPTSIAL